MTPTRTLPPVQVEARFVGPTHGTLRRLALGLPAAVSVTSQGRECGYLLSAHLEKGRVVGWRLEVCDPDRDDNGSSYDLPADLASCECRDYLSRSHRRCDGRCKHQHAVRQLLGRLGLPTNP